MLAWCSANPKVQLNPVIILKFLAKPLRISLQEQLKSLKYGLAQRANQKHVLLSIDFPSLIAHGSSHLTLIKMIPSHLKYPKIICYYMIIIGSLLLIEWLKKGDVCLMGVSIEGKSIGERRNVMQRLMQELIK